MVPITEPRESHSTASQYLNELKESVRQKRSRLRDSNVAKCAEKGGVPRVSFGSQDFVCCGTLEGHGGKIYSLDWAKGKDRIASVAQDGYLIVWNALTRQKIHAIKLACSWVMTCSFSPSAQSVACGGLDSVCTIYSLNSQQDQGASGRKVLNGHKGYVTCCKYLPGQENQILTSSGDKTCILWDVESSRKLSVFGGHTADVMSLSVSGVNTQSFVSGSIDGTACLWDMRSPSRAVQTFWDHEADVNTVQFLPDGLRFGTGSDDGVCRIFDTRTGHLLQDFFDTKGNETVKANSIAFSRSGRFLFAAYSNANCYVWDTLLAKVVCKLNDFPDSHRDVVSCLSLPSDGTAVCTGSWDKSLKIWALKVTK